MPHHTAGVSQARWVLGRNGVQQKPGGLHRRGAQHHDARFDLLSLSRGRVNIGNAARPAFAVHQNFTGQRVLPQGEIAGGGRLGQRATGRAENRRDIAAVHAVPAVVAGRTVVIGLGQHGLAHRDERNIQSVRGALQDVLTATPRQRRQIVLSAGRISRPSSLPQTPMICSTRS